MATPPALTPEQRANALAKAAEARAARAEFKNKLKLGSVSLSEALDSKDATVGKLKVDFGNLLTFPVGGGILYVEPVYTMRKGKGTYPTLAFVMASDGSRVGAGDTLDGAIANMFASGKVSSGGSTTGNPGSLSGVEISLLRQADQEFDLAQKALRKGDLTAYAKHVKQAQALVKQALAEAAPVKGRSTKGATGSKTSTKGSGR